MRIAEPRPCVLPIAELWARCLQSPPREWQGVVTSFLDRVVPTLAIPLADNLDTVRPSLRVQLLAARPEVPRLPAAIERRFADGVRAVLTLHTADIIEEVSPVWAQRWGVSPVELFAAAEANVRAGTALERTEWEADGVAVRRFTAQGFCTTAWVQWLPDLVELQPRAGALVGLPSRHEFVVHPIAGLSALRALRPMTVYVDRANRLGPGPLSPHLYWWQAGVLHRLSRRPSDEFLDALNGAA